MSRVLHRQDIEAIKNKLFQDSKYCDREDMFNLLMTIDHQNEIIKRSLSDYINATSELRSLEARTRK